MEGKAREAISDLLRKLRLEFGQSITGLTFAQDCIPLMDDQVRSKIRWYLKDICLIKDEVQRGFHVVFGHAHHGGGLLRPDRKVRVNGRFISLWNTGGWLVWNKPRIKLITRRILCAKGLCP